MMIRRACQVFVLVSTLSGWAAADVIREGTGERRAKLNAMELAAFPAENWGMLSGWAGGKAISSADTNGQVVLICTYSDWYPQGKRAWDLAQRLGKAHAKDGLVVVGAHHAEGFGDAKKPEPAKDGDKSSPRVFMAHDAKGEFRKALMSDQDPDFYVIDRAGQLRYADIATESVEEAVKGALAETTDAAAGLKGKLADEAAKRDAEARRTAAIRSEVDLRTLPEVPFTEPTPDAYEKVTWPKKIKTENSREDEGPVSLALAPPGQYYKKDPLTKGRAVVVYVWSPDFRRSYEKIMPDMEQLQKERGRDLAVIGAMVRIVDRDGRDEDVAETDPMKLIRSFVDDQGITHPQTAYSDGMIGAVDDRGNEIWVPYVVVASSNGTVRWAGSPIRNKDGFRAAVEQVIQADPGVKARRAAEEAFIKKQQGK